MNIDIAEIKKHLEDSYFRDYLQMVLRVLTFFGNLLIREKEEAFKDLIHIKNLSNKIKKKDENKFVNIVMKLMVHIPIDNPKFKEECFTNVKNFTCLYPDKISEQIQILSND